MPGRKCVCTQQGSESDSLRGGGRVASGGRVVTAELLVMFLLLFCKRTHAKGKQFQVIQKYVKMKAVI